MENLLNDIFSHQAIKLNLDGKTKEMVFAELIDAIAILHPEYNRTEMFTEIRKREEIMNTVVSSGVAIPHGFCTGIAGITGAIGVSQLGIDYGASDNKPVHIVFLLVINEQEKKNQIKALNLIYHFAQSKTLALIKKAKDAEEIYAILSSYHSGAG